MESSTGNFFGAGTDGIFAPSGEVTLPVSALTAAVSGETRNTCALFVPLRPSKLRLFVRSDTAPVRGLMCAPMQKPQAFSRMRQPALMRIASEPSAASMFTT